MFVGWVGGLVVCWLGGVFGWLVGWLVWYRRLSKDYEINAKSEENMIMIAHSTVLLRRLCY